MTQEKERLVLIDSHALIHRSYHALPPMTNRKGEVLNAVYGYASVLLKILKEMNPQYIAAAFDLPQPTFRHEEFEEYKAHREKAPDELISQFNKVKEVVRAFGIPVMEMPGFEADDILGTVAEKVKSSKLKVKSIILTGDLDTLQLVDDDNTVVYTLKKGITDTVIYDEKAVIERYSLRPDQMVDFKALKGDPSDNIPGVPGVGDKTASALVAKYRTLEEIYEEVMKHETRNIKQKKAKGGTREILSEKLIEKLIENKDQAFLSKSLSTIRRDAPIDFDIEKCRVGQYDKDKIEQLFKEMEFGSLIGRLPWKNHETQNIKHETNIEKSEETESIIDNQQKVTNLLSRLNLDSGTGETKPLKEIAILLKEDRETEKHSIIIALSNKESDEVEPPAEVQPRNIQYFKDVLENENIKKIGYDMKLLARILREENGIAIKGFDFDILLAKYALNPGNISDEELDTKDFFNLKEKYIKEIDVKKLNRIFYEIEMPLLPILAEMEKTGIKLDSEYLKNFSGELAEKLEKLEKDIYGLAGEEFNINSPQQISRILFDKLKIEVKGLRKTPGGVISTGAAELEKLRGIHPIIDLILNYREVFKLKSTYVDALPKMVAADGRIHTNYNQTGTSTGRLSSLEPNLQNIPIRTDLGASIRRAFIADSLDYEMSDTRLSQATDRAVFNNTARKEAQGITTQMALRNSKKGYKLVAFDYSQIELRLASVIAGDEKMKSAFKEDKDIHQMTASEIFNVPLEKVDEKMRRAAKTLNFGVLYGMSAKSFSETAKIEYADAKKFINEYFEDFAGISGYIENTVASAKKLGYVETIFGRRRYIPEMNTNAWQARQAAERMAVNMPIQGTAADIIKMAMIKIWDDLDLANRDDIRLLLQIHDELVFEIKEDIMEKEAEKIKEIMENVVELDVPLIVEMEYGDSLGDMNKI